MSKRNLKIVAAVVVAVVLCLVLLNWYISNQVKESFSLAIDEADQREDNIKVSYDKISSIPFLSTVSIHDLMITDEENSSSILVEKLLIKVPYNKTINMSSKQEEYMYPINAIAENPVVNTEYGSLSFEKINLNYDGTFKSEDIQNTFFDTDQYFKLILTNAKMIFNEKFITENNMDPSINDYIPILDNFSVVVQYIADNDEIDVQEFKMDMKYFNIDGIYNIVYDKNPDEPKLIAKGMATLNVSTNGESFGSLDKYGVISLGSLKTSNNIETAISLGKDFPEAANIYEVFNNLANLDNDTLNYMNNGFQSYSLPDEYKSEYKLELEGLTVEMGQYFNDGQNPIMFSQNMKKITINNVDLSVNSNNKAMDINGNIKSSLVDMDLIFDIESTDIIFDDFTMINNGKVVISNMSPELEMIVYFLEMENGQQFPREDGNIVIEMEGELYNPTIKGYDIY